MPDVILIVLGAIAAIIMLSCFIFACADHDAEAILRFLVTLLITASIGGWCYKAYMAPRPIVETVRYPIESFTYPDGTKIQTIQEDPLKKTDLTALLKKTFPEGTTIVRTKRTPWACGVYIVDGDAPEYFSEIPVTTQPTK